MTAASGSGKRYSEDGVVLEIASPLLESFVDAVGVGLEDLRHFREEIGTILLDFCMRGGVQLIMTSTLGMDISLL